MKICCLHFSRILTGACKENFSNKRFETRYSRYTCFVSSVLCWKPAYSPTFRSWFSYIPRSTRIFQSGSTNAISIAGCSPTLCWSVCRIRNVRISPTNRCNIEKFRMLGRIKCARSIWPTLNPVRSTVREAPLIFFFSIPLFRAFRVWLNFGGNWVVNSQPVVISSVLTSIRDSCAHRVRQNKTLLGTITMHV